MLYDEPPEPPPPPSPSIAAAPQATPQLQQQNYLPQTSLLKIEPFVPSFNQRLRRRPIGRSHSTLSHNVIQKRVAQAAAAAAGGGGGANTQPPPQPELLVGHGQLKRSYAAAAQLRSQQRLQRGTVTRQRSKSTSSSAASNSCRPATSAGISATAGTSAVVAAATPTTLVGSTGGTLVSGAIVTPQPNGICRIQRLAKEREELPDRINYDRRGLTAIPIFEQEPNLRLLSLQHNLINTFHIPKELPPPPPPPPAPPQIPTVPQATPRDNNVASK